MNLALAILIAVVATSVAIVAMLWVRRRAPDGSYFHDGDRAAGVFGVLATGFSVLLGFVVFLAFTSYDSARAGAERIHGAIGVIPLPLWLVLFFISAVIFVYTLFFADSGERAVVQALLMGTVVAVIVAMLLLTQFLNNPFHDGIGGLRPDAMGRTLKIIDQELTPAQRQLPLPCDVEGNPL
jgi:hypothetical protein